MCVPYLCSGDQFHKRPAVWVPDQFNNQLLAGGQLMEAVAPPRGAAAGGGGVWGRFGTWDRSRQSSPGVSATRRHLGGPYLPTVFCSGQTLCSHVMAGCHSWAPDPQSGRRPFFLLTCDWMDLVSWVQGTQTDRHTHLDVGGFLHALALALARVIVGALEEGRDFPLGGGACFFLALLR